MLIAILSPLDKNTNNSVPSNPNTIAVIRPLAPSQYIPPSQVPPEIIRLVIAKNTAIDTNPAITGALCPLELARKYPIPNATYTDITLIVPTCTYKNRWFTTSRYFRYDVPVTA